jgi:hypothetical protein
MPRKAKTYFTLLVNDGTPGDRPWGIQFGDYDRSVVEAELEDYRDHGWKRKELKIVETVGHGNAEIEAIVAKLNDEATA